MPVEVVHFAWRHLAEYLETPGADPTLSLSPGEDHFMTDQCNFILDCTFGPISDPAALAASSEHGISSA